MKTWLVDTGPFVAYFNRADPSHDAVAAVLEPFTGQLVTTAAVVTEVMYFVSSTGHGPAAFAEFLLASGTRIADLGAPHRIVEAVRLMTEYADTPMDFADATLVLLAGELGVRDILTLDRRGFATYRTANGRPFQLVLS